MSFYEREKMYIIQNDKYQIIEKILFYVLLVVAVGWFFLFIDKGIDLTDQGFVLTKYKYFFDTDVNVKSFGTFLTDFLGACIYRLIDSKQFLVLSLFSWGMYMVSEWLVYRCLKKYVPKILLMIGLLGGSLYSLTWLGHGVSYNATSMFLQTVAIYILIKGVEKEKLHIFFVAGLIFAINTFFRLPNVLQISIGVCIIWYFVFCEKRIKQGLRALGVYAGGAITGWSAGLILALIVIGKNGIISYFSMVTNEVGSSQSSHGIVNILIKLYSGLLNAGKDWMKFGVPIIFILSIWLLAKKYVEFKGKRYFDLTVATVLLFYGIYIGRKIDFYRICPMIAICVLSIMFIGIFYYKTKDSVISTICVIGFCAEAVLCIGTDNAWTYQVVFMIFPICLCLLAVWRYSGAIIKEILLMCTVFVVTLYYTVGVGFAVNYVYRDAPNKELKYAVKAEEYKGIYTSKERAQYLNELSEVLEPLEEPYLLAYGDFNTGYIITDKKPFFGQIWSDLQGYSLQIFKKDLEKEIEEKGYPIILLADTDKDGIYRSEEKLQLIKGTMEQGRYRSYYANEWYTIYRPE